MTPPELRLWSALRRRPDGLKFRRQHPFGPFVLDFYCDMAKLGVEVDGSAHDLGENPVRDRVRDVWLREHGIGIMRFAAEEVRVNLDGVVTGIVAAAMGRSRQALGPLHHASHGPPPPEGEETRNIGDDIDTTQRERD